MTKAKKKSYDWFQIRLDFDKGLSQAELRKKYDIPAGTLGSKIKRDGWVLSQEQTSTLDEFRAVSAKLSENYYNANESQQKEMVDRVEIILEDNDLVVNNRKLLRVFQNKMIQILKDGGYETALEIRQGVSSIKDIEAVANPQSNKQEINIQNTQQVAQSNQLNLKELSDDELETLNNILSKTN